jgi:hypothetical protein
LVDLLPVLINGFKADVLLDFPVFVLGIINPISNGASDLHLVRHHHKLHLQPLANALELVHKLFPEQNGLLECFLDDNAIHLCDGLLLQEDAPLFVFVCLLLDILIRVLQFDLVLLPLLLPLQSIHESCLLILCLEV